MQARGDYFDGRSSTAHRVRLSLERRGEEPWLVVGPDEGAPISEPASLQIVPVRELRVSERLGTAPRVLELPAGRGRIELHRDAATEALLAALGLGEAWSPRLARSVPAILLSMVLLAALAWVGYRQALPWIAEVAAARMPQDWVDRISRPALDWVLEGTRVSSVAAERQAALREAVARARWPGLAGPLRLHFRDAPSLGANALALPSGDILLTDGLVALAGPRDDLVLAVIAHEVGHVAERHGLRSLIHGSLVSALATWWLGDVSALAAVAPTLLTQAVYSREMETAADEYAARALREQGQTAESLVLMLERLQTAAAASAPKGGRPPRWLDHLASHPQTPERMARLRKAASGP